MRLGPERGGEGDLGLLTGGEHANGTVERELFVDTEVGQVLHDLTLGQGAVLETTLGGGALVIVGEREGLATEVLQELHVTPGVLLSVEAHPLNLVEHVLTTHLTTHERVDLSVVLTVLLSTLLTVRGLPRTLR